MSVKHKLVKKYITYFAVLVGGVLLISGLVESYYSYLDHRQALIAVQREKALAAAGRIEQFIKTIERQVLLVSQAQLSAANDSDDRRLEYIRLLRQAPPVTEIRGLNAAGRELLKVSRLALDVMGSQKDFSSDPNFQAAKSGGTIFSPVYFRNDSEPYMKITIRGQGKNAVVVMAEVNLKFIWDVVSRIRIGKSGHAYVVDGRARLIAHPNISLVLQKKDLSKLKQVQMALPSLNKSERSMIKEMESLNSQGRQVLTTSVPIIALGWLVFVDLPLGEAFAPFYASLYRSAGLALLGFGLSVLVSIFLSNKMVRPIRVVQAGAARVREGAFEKRINIKTGDELEALADEFNKMAAHLQESYANLERKVELRTRELAVANEKLDESSQHKSQFLANMSHELRTPLNGILGLTEMILDNVYGDVPEKIYSAIEDVQSSGRHLLGLINDVLDLAKIEAGREALHLRDYSLQEIVQAVSTIMRPLASAKGLELEVTISSDLPPGKGDYRRISQVILNLVANAIKFTEAGKVHIKVMNCDGSFCVSVSDTGPGIMQTDQERIFEQFHQIDGTSTRQKGGTGLGLTIAKRIIEMHGGRIWVESERGTGSVFQFKLPRIVDRPANEK